MGPVPKVLGSRRAPKPRNSSQYSASVDFCNYSGRRTGPEDKLFGGKSLRRTSNSGGNGRTRSSDLEAILSGASTLDRMR